MQQILQNLGMIFSDFISPVLISIKADNVGAGLAFIIVIAAGIITIYVTTFTLVDYRKIKLARKIMASFETEEEFAKEFNTINQKMLDIPKVKFAWKEFTETLVLPKAMPDGLTAVCSNTVRPHNYFNLHELDMGPGFTKIFPNIFVGVGLALTFLGLISALTSAVNGMQAAAGDSLALQGAIQGLLNAASAKFYASLFALLSSIVLTLLIRFATGFLASQISKLNNQLESGVRYLTREGLAIEANEIMRNQLVQLNTFNTDLAIKIGEQVQQSLITSLDPLVKKIESMGGDLTEQNIKAIEDISKNITDSITGATSGSMDKVAETLDMISDKLGLLSDSLTNALGNFDSDFQKILSTLKSSFEAGSSGISEGIDEGMAKLNGQVHDSVVQIESILSNLGSTIGGLVSLGENISREGSKAISNSTKKAAEDAGKLLSEAGNQLAAGFESSTKGLVDSLELTTSQLNSLNVSLKPMPDRFDSINTNLESSSVSIQSAGSKFTEASSEFRMAIEPLSDYASETRKSLEMVSNGMLETSNNISTSSQEMTRVVTVLKDDLVKQLDQLNGSDEHLAKLLSGIESSTGQVLHSIDGYVVNIDKGFRDSIGTLQQSIEEFEDVVESLRKVIVK